MHSSFASAEAFKMTLQECNLLMAKSSTNIVVNSANNNSVVMVGTMGTKHTKKSYLSCMNLLCPMMQIIEQPDISLYKA